MTNLEAAQKVLDEATWWYGRGKTPSSEEKARFLMAWEARDRVIREELTKCPLQRQCSTAQPRP